MKKLIAALCVTSVLALAVHAGEGDAAKKKHEPSAAMKELLAKYDANKDGKLDKGEMSKMSAEDKEAFAKMHRKHEKKEHEEKEKAEKKAKEHESGTAPASK